MKKQTTTRRDFLIRASQASCALAIPTIVPSTVFGKNAPSNRIHLAMLGVGSRGGGVMNGFTRNSDAQFVAICDPFRDRRERAKKAMENKYGQNSVKAYADFREVMARDDVDAVIVCTPDHWHVPLGIAAARAGKDMYIEKPLGVSLQWAWRLRDVIQRHGSVFQYGTMQRSTGHFRHVCELVRNGYLGQINKLDAWAPDGTRAKQWMTAESVIPEPVPENLSYDLWLGPAPVKPYNHFRVNREGAFHTYDYAIGFIAGWGAHPLDIAQWGLDMDHSGPVQYEGTGVIPTAGLYNTINDWDVHCKYANGTAMHFMNQTVAKPVAMKYRKRWSEHGTTFFGDEGWVSVDRGGIEYSNPKLQKIKLKPGDVHLIQSTGHDRNFLDCIKSRAATLNPIESAIRSDTISHLSDITIRTGRSLKWDPENEKIIGDKQASRLLNRPMRAPYQF